MRVGISTVLGVGMLGLGAAMQQSGYYDLGQLGDVWKDTGGFIEGAAKTAGAGIPLEPAMLYIALFIGAAKSIEPTIRELLARRRTREEDERREAALKAQHEREIERLRIQHELDSKP